MVYFLEAISLSSKRNLSIQVLEAEPFLLRGGHCRWFRENVTVFQKMHAIKR